MTARIAIGRPARLLGLCLAVLALSAGRALAIVDADEVTAASGPAGVLQANPGTEVQIYQVELYDQNPNGVNADLGLAGTNPGLQLYVTDLPTPTGFKAADLVELRLYASNDAILDGGDGAPIATVNPVTVSETSFNQFDVTGLPLGGVRRLPNNPVTVWFIVSAVLSDAATLGRAFTVKADTPHIGITNSGFPPVGFNGELGSMIGPSNGQSVVVGDQVIFLVATGGGGVSIPFGGEGAILVVLLASGSLVLYRRQR